MVHHSRFLSFITKQATPGTTHSLVVYVKDDLRGGQVIDRVESYAGMRKVQFGGCIFLPE